MKGGQGRLVGGAEGGVFATGGLAAGKVAFLEVQGQKLFDLGKKGRVQFGQPAS